MERFLQYIDLHWWVGVEKRDIESWINNFGDNSELARIILGHIIFYNEEQLKAYTRVLINRLKNKVYMDCVQKVGYSYINDENLLEKWEEFLQTTVFIPASTGNPADSAYKVIRYWRTEIKRENCFTSVNRIEELYKNGVRRFIFIDDFSGSGNQMADFLKTKIIINGVSIEIGHLPDKFDDIEIIIALYVIHKKSKEKLNGDYPKVNLMAIDVLDDRASFLNENSYIYKGLNPEQTREYVEAIKEINKTILDENGEFRELSSYILNIPIVFQYGCPNNALLLLFAHTDHWKQLFKRGNGR